MELGGHSRDDCRDGIRLLLNDSSLEGRGKQPASMPEASWAGGGYISSIICLKITRSSRASAIEVFGVRFRAIFS